MIPTELNSQWKVIKHEHRSAYKRVIWKSLAYHLKLSETIQARAITSLWHESLHWRGWRNLFISKQCGYVFATSLICPTLSDGAHQFHLLWTALWWQLFYNRCLINSLDKRNSHTLVVTYTTKIFRDANLITPIGRARFCACALIFSLHVFFIITIRNASCPVFAVIDFSFYECSSNVALLLKFVSVIFWSDAVLENFS